MPGYPDDLADHDQMGVQTVCKAVPVLGTPIGGTPGSPINDSIRLQEVATLHGEWEALLR